MIGKTNNFNETNKIHFQNKVAFIPVDLKVFKGVSFRMKKVYDPGSLLSHLTDMFYEHKNFGKTNGWKPCPNV